MIDDEIIRLKSLRNALQPISRLSPELLEKIFMMRTAKFIDQTRDLALRCPTRWFAFSHVCRYWRAVALGCPTLWSCIAFNHTTASGIAEMLSRAEGAALRIVIGPFETNAADGIAAKKCVLYTFLASGGCRECATFTLRYIQTSEQ